MKNLFEDVDKEQLEQILIDGKILFELLQEYMKNHTIRKGFKTSWENMPEKLMLCVTELSEAMEDWRDDNKEHFKEELADIFVRLLDICSVCDMNLFEQFISKMEKNEQRPFKHGRKNG